MNGVSGLMDGYRGEEDLPLLVDALHATGFSKEEAAAIKKKFEEAGAKVEIK